MCWTYILKLEIQKQYWPTTYYNITYGRLYITIQWRYLMLHNNYLTFYWQLLWYDWEIPRDKSTLIGYALRVYKNVCRLYRQVCSVIKIKLVETRTSEARLNSPALDVLSTQGYNFFLFIKVDPKSTSNYTC